ncbi:MAG: hypothetical protein ACLQT7_00765 [Candidatus Dormibacteria bacterium]
MLGEGNTPEIVPSGACPTLPEPQIDFLNGFTGVTPGSSAASIKPLAVAGGDTVSDTVNPRNPVVGASEGRTRT